MGFNLFNLFKTPFKDKYKRFKDLYCKMSFLSLNPEVVCLYETPPNKYAIKPDLYFYMSNSNETKRILSVNENYIDYWILDDATTLNAKEFVDRYISTNGKADQSKLHWIFSLYWYKDSFLVKVAKEYNELSGKELDGLLKQLEEEITSIYTEAFNKSKERVEYFKRVL